MVSKTQRYIERVRNATASIKSAVLQRKIDDQRDSLQEEINQLGQELDNPTLSCLRDLVKLAREYGFAVYPIESQLFNYKR
jgi:hypothetical protein